MRLFISVNLDEDTKDSLLELQSVVRSQVIKGNFTRPENFHITLAFLGETPHETIAGIKAVFVSTFSEARPFTVMFNRIGCFTHSGKELWWIGAESPELFSLRKKLCAALTEEDIAYDKRSFNAHITLGREIKTNVPASIDQVNIAVEIRRVSLMESRRKNGILMYTELFGCDLF